MPLPASLSVLGILLFLLPGFLSALLVRQIAVRAKQSDFEKLIEALVFSFVLYLFNLPWFGDKLPISWHQTASEYQIHMQWGQLAALFLEAVLLSGAYGFVAQHDLLHKSLRKMKITERTSRVSIWNDVLQDIRSTYLFVDLKDGRRVFGYLTYYSDDPEEGSLFLEDAAWVDEKGE